MARGYAAGSGNPREKGNLGKIDETEPGPRAGSRCMTPRWAGICMLRRTMSTGHPAKRQLTVHEFETTLIRWLFAASRSRKGWRVAVRRLRLPIAAIALALVRPGAAVADASVIAIPVVYQETKVWCWAATATMALQAFGYPNVNPGGNFQCGIVAVTFPQCDADCRQCEKPIGPLPNMLQVIRGYQDFVERTRNFRVPRVQPRYVPYPTFEQIKASVRAGYPVIAGISPWSGRPQDPGHTDHAVLITGYREDNGGATRELTINDPYPYRGIANPYEQAGATVDAQTGVARVTWSTATHYLHLTSAILLSAP
jgi:hypothetical protein